jgi:putative inorganic carbon (hco3(-)) transporter
VIAIAALSGPLPKLGVIAVALLAAGAMLTRDDAARAWAMLGALVLAPVLLLADIWHSPQLNVIHRHPLEAAVGAAVALAVLGGVAAVIARRPALLAPLTMVALPFRIPIEVGDTTSNLLVPLYFVIAAASLAWIVPTLWPRRDPGGGVPFTTPPEPEPEPDTGADDPQPPNRARGALFTFERILAAYVVLYAIQSLYSPDFEKALQQMVFFYVPFALLMRLLRDLEWTRELAVHCLQVTLVLAVIFVGIGCVEYATKTLLLNPKLIAANNVHTYFTVNSVFFDPDIFGRYLALVMIVTAAVLIYDRRPRVQIGVTVLLAILWGGLVLTLSRSSLGALLLGLATLSALRTKIRPVLVAAGVVLVVGGAAIAITPKTFGLNQGLNGASSGRANLISGGLTMFGDRPIWGYGSGAFVTVYQEQNPGTDTTLSASHTIAITIAAEQGLIGVLVYVALVVAALIALFRGCRGDPLRAATAAAFLALVLHTELYADFLEDPFTWTLLGVGAALAAQGRAAITAADRAATRAARATRATRRGTQAHA